MNILFLSTTENRLDSRLFLRPLHPLYPPMRIYPYITIKLFLNKAQTGLGISKTGLSEINYSNHSASHPCDIWYTNIITDHGKKLKDISVILKFVFFLPTKQKTKTCSSKVHRIINVGTRHLKGGWSLCLSQACGSSLEKDAGRKMGKLQSSLLVLCKFTSLFLLFFLLTVWFIFFLYSICNDIPAALLCLTWGKHLISDLPFFSTSLII